MRISGSSIMRRQSSVEFSQPQRCAIFSNLGFSRPQMVFRRGARGRSKNWFTCRYAFEWALPMNLYPIMPIPTRSLIECSDWNTTFARRLQPRAPGGCAPLRGSVKVCKKFVSAQNFKNLFPEIRVCPSEANGENHEHQPEQDSQSAGLLPDLHTHRRSRSRPGGQEAGCSARSEVLALCVFPRRRTSDPVPASCLMYFRCCAPKLFL